MRGTIVRVRIGLSVRAEVVGDSGKLIEGGLQILGDHIRLGEACGVLEALVPEPEKVKVDLVALDQVFVGVGVESLWSSCRLTWRNERAPRRFAWSR